jgi:hypothetical protein
MICRRGAARVEISNGPMGDRARYEICGNKRDPALFFIGLVSSVFLLWERKAPRRPQRLFEEDKKPRLSQKKKRKMASEPRKKKTSLQITDSSCSTRRSSCSCSPQRGHRTCPRPHSNVRHDAPRAPANHQHASENSQVRGARASLSLRSEACEEHELPSHFEVKRVQGRLRSHAA